MSRRKNHRRLINLSILTRIVVLVLTNRFNSYERSITTTIHPKIIQRNYETYKQSRGSIQRNYTSKNFTINIRATKHLVTCITIAMIVFHSFPNAMQKKGNYTCYATYDPTAAQHNGHSQIYHSRNIIESHNQNSKEQTHTRQ